MSRRDALLAVVSQLDPRLPDCLPILDQALVSRGPDPALAPRPELVDLAALPLSALLSRVLLSFAFEYEREAELALAVGANVLRVLGAEGTRLRDLPILTGTSREAVRWALGVLRRAPGRSGARPGHQPRTGRTPYPQGHHRPARLPSARPRYRAAVAGALPWRRHRRRPADSRTAGDRPRRPGIAPVARPGALPGQLAGPGPPVGHPPVLPDGPASRRLSRRQLTQNRFSRFTRALSPVFVVDSGFVVDWGYWDALDPPQNPDQPR
jgi:hypothetical protein